MGTTAKKEGVAGKYDYYFEQLGDMVDRTCNDC